MKVEEIYNPRIHRAPIKMNTNMPIKKNEYFKPYSTYENATLISGGPGSGKTSLIIDNLTHKNGLFYQVFNRIYIFSPSMHTLNHTINLDKDRFFTTFDIEALKQIVEEQAQCTRDGIERHILIIIDDMMAEITNVLGNEVLTKIICNRRHLQLDIIVITQTFNSVKLILRKNFSHIISFKCANREFDALRSEVGRFNVEEWRQLLNKTLIDKHDFLMFWESNIYKNFNELKIIDK